MNQTFHLLYISFLLFSGCRSGGTGDNTTGCIESRPTLETEKTTAGKPPEAASSTPNRNGYFIEQPIVLGGYIAGDVRKGTYIPLDDKAVNAAWTAAEDATNGREPVLDFVRLPAKLQLFGKDSSTMLTPDKAQIVLDCGGQPMAAFAWRNEGVAGQVDLLGMDARLNLTPRATVTSADNAPWDGAVRELLRSLGKPKATVQIQSVRRVDLLGDGKEDVVITAAHLKRRGRCARNPDANGCASSGEFDATKSYGFVAVAMDGAAPLKILLDYFSDNLIWRLDDSLFADVDGDNKLELVFRISYYEGRRAGVMRIEPDRATEVLSLDCML